MRRRTFLRRVLGGGAGAGLLACVTADPDAPGPEGDGPDAGAGRGDGGGASDATPGGPDACTAHVTMYDTHAQALYLDGSLGPLTGVITVAYVVAGAPITLDFWHGHGGQQHRFTLLPAHFDALKRGERVDVGTSEVDGHSHTLFIDPTDPGYRVDGAPPIDVSTC